MAAVARVQVYLEVADVDERLEMRDGEDYQQECSAEADDHDRGDVPGALLPRKFEAVECIGAVFVPQETDLPPFSVHINQ